MQARLWLSNHGKHSWFMRTGWLIISWTILNRGCEVTYYIFHNFKLMPQKYEMFLYVLNNFWLFGTMIMEIMNFLKNLVDFQSNFCPFSNFEYFNFLKCSKVTRTYLPIDNLCKTSKVDLSPKISLKIDPIRPQPPKTASK